MNRQSASRTRWTTAEDQQLRELFSGTPTAKIAKLMNRSVCSIHNRAGKFSLKKSPEYLATPYAGRLRPGHNQGGATRFKKGLTPWNKGTHFTAGGRSAETRFKAGHLSGRAAQVVQPIGAERVSKDGYIERKINNDLPFQSRWRGVHLIRWEAINGRLPVGHALVFRDGDKTNHAPENMELISRSELMRRNTIHNRYPKEVVQLIQLRGALKRKIRNRSARDEKQDV